ncbi:MAG: hypothetical protein ACRDRC_00915 [Pseudonocardiaceae bacterium]
MADDDTSTELDTGEGDTEAQKLLADAVDQNSGADTEPDGTDWKAEADRLAKDAAKWKALARKHEGTARQRSDAASKAKTLEEQVAELRSQMAERDVAEVERSGRLALAHVHTKLAEAGIKPGDVAGLLELVDPVQLLIDGQLDDKAIDKLAGSLTKVAARVTPDHDQGRKGGEAPQNMNDLIRRAAGVRTN